MKNEELIDRQLCQMCNQRRACIKNNRNRCIDYEDAVEILKEKDQQFKEYLEKKRLEYAHKREAHKFNACNEIINELFKEEKK